MISLLSLIALPAVKSAPALEPYELTVPGTVVKIKMIPVEGGTIKIRGKEVTIKPFYIAETETPWEAYDAFLSSGPPSKPYDQSQFAADAVARPSKSYILPDLNWGHRGYPVINVSFTSVTMFCRWIAQTTKTAIRLPHEAEWEFVYRAGGGGDKTDKATAEKMGWIASNAGDMTHPIKKKAPNKLGIYDMLGNVGEWGTDLEGKDVLLGPTFQDKLGDVTAGRRQYYDPLWQEEDPQIPKSRWWLSDGPFCGFRMVCEPSG